MLLTLNNGEEVTLDLHYISDDERVYMCTLDDGAFLYVQLIESGPPTFNLFQQVQDHAPQAQVGVHLEALPHEPRPQ